MREDKEKKLLRMLGGKPGYVDVGSHHQPSLEGRGLAPGWEGSQTINIGACKKEGHVQDPHIFLVGHIHWRKVWKSTVRFKVNTAGWVPFCLVINRRTCVA